MSGNYPRLLINLNHFKNNVEKTIDRCKQCNVEITGVIKGVNGLPEVTETYISGGVKSIGTSRLEQFEGIRERHPDISLMLIRTPMLSEIEDVVRLTDISLNTEIQVIRALDEEAKRQGKIHQVLLMIDVGDLREGFFDEEELEIIKRGRNAQTKTIAKNADMITYRMATGFEAIVGYYYLSGQCGKLEKLWNEVVEQGEQ